MYTWYIHVYLYKRIFLRPVGSRFSTCTTSLVEQEWLDIELEREDGRWVYELELLDDAGVVREYLFDARTGLSLGFEIED